MLVTRNFPPLVGGMENVNYRLLKALSECAPALLCGPQGASAYAADADEVRETAIKPLPRFLILTLLRCLALARKFRPCLVMGGSGLVAPIVWMAARLAGARSALYLHGLDIVAPSRIYQTLWLPFIRSAEIVFVNSQHTAGLARARGVKSDRIHLLHPGTEIAELNPLRANAFRTREDLGERLVLLSVGRLTQRKGLTEFVGMSLPRIVAAYPDCVLLVIGDEAVDALHSRGGSQKDRIVEAARMAGVESNLRFFGRCDGPTLDAAYEAASFHVFPVMELPGDVEGFGMVALESAAHGLQTVAFAVGGVPDAVRDGVTGRLVSPGDYNEFARVVIDLAKVGSNPATIGACRDFASDKSWAKFGQRLKSVLQLSPP